MYPTISDRILRTKDYYCHFVPAENPKFVIALAFLGHHIPCIVIMVCYVIVFYEIRKLFKTRPEDKAAAAAKAQAKAKAGTNVVAPAPGTFSMALTTTANLTPSTSKDPTTGHGEKGVEIADNDAESAHAAECDNNKKEDKKKKQKYEQPQQQHQKKHQTAAGGSRAAADVKERAHRERKSFITLSYIVIGYVICWVPFHFVYDVSFISPQLVSDDLYTATFWLTYVNSGINPFLYAFSSADLRNAVVQMLKCRYMSK